MPSGNELGLLIYANLNVELSKEKINKDLEIIGGKINSLKLKVDVDSKNINNIASEIDALHRQLRNNPLVIHIKQVTNGLEKIENYTKTTSSYFMSMGQKIVEAMESPIQGIFSATTTGILDSIVDGFHSMIDIEEKMAGYAQTNGHFFTTLKDGVETIDFDKVNKQAEQFIQTVHAVGGSIDETIESARLWGRVYNDVNIVQELVRQSVRLSTIDFSSLEDATKSMESVILQYGVQIRNTNDAMVIGNRILDSWSKVAHETMAPAVDLGTAFERTGKIAAETGVSFDFMNGLISSGLRDTVLTGENLGNMWNTILGSIRTNKAVDEIEQLGVKTKEIVNGTEQWRKAEDIIVELSTKVIDKNYDLTKSYEDISRGMYQYSKLAASLNAGDILLGTAASIGSTGSTIEYLKSQMDTIQRKSAQVKTSLVEVFNTAGNDGLRNSIKGILDIADSLLIGLSRIPSGLFNVVSILGTISLGVLALAKPVSNLVTAINTLRIARIADTSAIGSNTIATDVNIVSSNGAILSSVRKTVVTEANTVATGANILATEGATVAIGAMTAAEATATVAMATATAGLSLLVGVLAIFAFNVGKAEQAERDRAQALKDEDAIIQQKIGQYDRQLELLPKLIDTYKSLQKALDSGTLSADKQIQVKKQLDQVSSALAITLGKEGAEQLRNAKFSDEATQKAYEELEDKQKKLREAQSTTYSNQEEELTKQIQVKQKELIDAKKELDVARMLASNATADNEVGRAWLIQFDEAQKKVDELTPEVDKLSLSLAEVKTKQAELAFESANQLAGSTSNVTEQIDALTESYDGLEKALGDSLNSISTLASAYQTLQGGESLSLETTLELIDKYPQFAKYLNEHNGLIQDKGRFLEQIANFEREERLGEQQRLLGSTEDLWKSLESKRQMYEQFYRTLGASLPQDQLNNIGGELWSDEDNKLLETLKKEREQIQAKIKALEKPIELKTFGTKQQKSGSSGSKEKQPFESNLNVNKYEEAVKNANRALEENQRAIEFNIAAGKPYDEQLNKRIGLTNDLNDAFVKLRDSHEKTQNKLKTKLSGLGLLDKNSNTIENIDEKLKQMSEKEYTGKKLTYGDTIKNIAEAVKKYMELPDILAGVDAKIAQNVKNITDTLDQYAHQIKNAGEKRRSDLNFKISMLGEVNTAEDKKLLASYSEKILKSYVEERDKLQTKMDEQKAVLNNKKSPDEQKQYAQIYINQHTQELNDSKAYVIKQAETVGKQQAEAIVFSYSKQIEELKFNLSLLGNIDTDEDKEKAKQINEEIKKVLLQEKESINSQILELERKLTLKLAEEERSRIQAKLDDLKVEQRVVFKSLVDSSDEEKRVRTENANKIVQVMKKAYQEIMKAEKEQHDQKIKMLDDEMKNFKEIVDEKIKEIDRVAAAEDYTENLKKKQQEAQDIQNKINELAVDDSIETKGKIADLEKQHADKIDEINKMQKDHTKDLRKQELQDSVDMMQKDTDAKKKKLNDDFELSQQHWQNILDDEAYWLKVENELINNHTSEVVVAMGELKEKVATLAQFMGDSIQKNLTKNLQDGIDLMNKATGGSSIGSGSNSNINPNTNNRFSPVGNGQYIPTSTNEFDIIGLMYRNSQEWKTTTPARKAELERINQDYGKQINATYNSKSGTWSKGGLRLYHDGGEAGGSVKNFADWLHTKLNLKSDEVVGILKSGEFVLKNNPIADLASSIKMPAIASIMWNQNSGPQMQSLTFDKLIHVDKIEKDFDIDHLLNRINNKFKSWGFITQ